MTQTDRSTRAGPVMLALALLATAGFTDALGFLGFGLYPSFMSGNSTNLAVALAQGERPREVALFAAVVIFVAGAFLGRLVRLRTGRRAPVLMVQAVLLALSGVAARGGLDAGALAGATLAMGLQNAALGHAGKLPVGTYVTGALVRLGVGLADALAGRGSAWAGEGLLWLALVVGAAAGAAAFHRYGLQALWTGAVAALALAAATAFERPDDNTEPAA